MATEFQTFVSVTGNLTGGANVEIRASDGRLVASGITGAAGSCTFSLDDGAYAASAHYTDPLGTNYEGSQSFTVSSNDPQQVTIVLHPV